MKAVPASLLVVALSVAPLARAQQPPTPRPPADLADPEGRARDLFREGSQLYDQARYDDAIARFDEAYRLAPHPDLLFNIAQAYRQKGPGFCATAQRYYERHLAEAPDAPNRAEVEELIREMRQCAAVAASAPPAPPRRSAPAVVDTAVPPAPEPAPPPRWPRWVALAGGALAVAGVAAYTASWVKYESVRDECPCTPGRFHTWERVSSASYVAMGIGGVGLALGLTVSLWPRAHAETALAPWAAPGAAGLAAAARF